MSYCGCFLTEHNTFVPLFHSFFILQEKSGVHCDHFDLFCGDVKMEEHKALYAYMSAADDTKMELSIRRSS